MVSLAGHTQGKRQLLAEIGENGVNAGMKLICLTVCRCKKGWYIC